jgi:hypothetical protein
LLNVNIEQAGTYQCVVSKSGSILKEFRVAVLGESQYFFFNLNLYATYLYVFTP